jgi:multisubunit Na+/H+ antiporter MnhB subunit
MILSSSPEWLSAAGVGLAPGCVLALYPLLILLLYYQDATESREIDRVFSL